MPSLDVITPLKAKAEELGTKVRELKEQGVDFKPVLNELLQVKKELSDAVQAYLPTIQAKIEELKASGSAALEVALKDFEELKSYIVEDKAAKKKREKEEKKKKQQEQEQSAGKKEEGGLSKKEMNKLMKKQKKAEAKGKTNEPDAPPASTSSPSSPAAAPAAQSSPSVAYDLSFPLASTVVSTVTGANCIKSSTAELFVNVEKQSMSQEKSANTVALHGDQTIAKHLARMNPAAKLYGESSENPTLTSSEIDQWLEFALTYPLAAESTLAMLEQHLSLRTFLAGECLSVADIAVWAGLVRAFGQVDPSTKTTQLPGLSRWLEMLKGVNGCSVASAKYRKHVASGGAQKKKQPDGGKKGGGKGAAKAMDKFNLPALDGGKEGQVVTRFPPEPSGHLHIGHVKAIFLNKYYADRYKGKMLVRFDDTNPSKEKVEFEEGIIEDLKHLGIQPASVSHTSDHFDTIIKYTVKLIQDGNAYMDDTTQEVMSQQRREGTDSVRRGEAPHDSLVRFFGMLFGTDAGLKAPEYGVSLSQEDVAYISANTSDLLTKWCLRAKIGEDTREAHKGNKALFDPVIFRGNTEPHARTGTKYRAYPTYDLACPIVDSVEGVTHAMRDIHYRDRSPLYAWFFKALGIRSVKIQEFSRMNFVYTVLSKRNLKWFVETGRVPGWDDPRFPTVKGILRRGMQIDALFDFMVAQGGSKNIVDMEWDKFWNLNKKHIDPVAPRFMAVSKDSNIVVRVFNEDGTPFPESFKTVPLLPKDKDGEQFGFKSLFLGPEVLVEKEDLEGGVPGVDKLVVGEKVVFLNWGVVHVTKIDTAADGSITSVDATFEPNGDFKAPAKKIHWVVKSPHTVNVTMHEFDFLITKSKLEEGDEFEKYIQENSEATTELIGEPGLRNMEHDSFLQLLRRGYFRVDQPLRPGSSLSLFMIPDGKTKAMSTLSTKLAHR